MKKIELPVEEKLEIIFLNQNKILITYSIILFNLKIFLPLNINVGV